MGKRVPLKTRPRRRRVVRPLSRTRSRPSRRNNQWGMQSRTLSARPMPISMNYSMASTPPKPVSFTNREQLATVGSPLAVTSYPINPGLPTNVVVSRLANLFDKYHFTSLSFTYIPLCSATVGGEITLAFDFDCLDPVPADISSMQAKAQFVSGSIREVVTLKVDCARLHKQYREHFVRNSTIPGTDLKTYDPGQLFIAVDGDTVATVGRVYMSYSVVFEELDTTPIEVTNGGTLTGGGDMSKAAIFGTVPVSIGNLPYTWSGNTLTFVDKWQGAMSLYITGTAGASWVETGTATTTPLSAMVDASGVFSLYVFAVDAVVGSTLVFGSAGTWTTVTSTTLWCAPLIYDYLVGLVDSVSTPKHVTSTSSSLTSSLLEAIASTKAASTEIKKMRGASLERKR